MPGPRPAIVLVHGAFANTSTWSKLIPLLTAKGFSVVAVHCPLSSLADDVAAVERVIGMQDAPVLLVGHSWGGAIITEAGNDAKVRGLVYIAAAAPDSGESFNEWWMGSPPAPGAPEITFRCFLSRTRSRTLSRRQRATWAQTSKRRLEPWCLPPYSV